MNIPLWVVNSFSVHGTGGNPCAVIFPADGLTSADMQAIAHQMNLVESVFVCTSHSPDADYSLRFFTPLKELPLAGHPTIAAFYVLAHLGAVQGGQERMLRQKTLGGVLPVRLIFEDGKIRSIRMAQSLPRFGEEIKDPDLLSSICNALHIDVKMVTDTGMWPRLVDTGLPELVVPVRDLASLMQIRRNILPLKKVCDRTGAKEVQAFCLDAYSSRHDAHTRNICPREGLEDPACGMGNGALVSYLAAAAITPGNQTGRTSWKIEQGHVSGFPSLIEVEVAYEDGVINEVWAGGEAKIVLTGTYYLNNNSNAGGISHEPK